MNAVVVRQGRMFVEELQRPSAGPGEVVLDIQYCGICGTDVSGFASQVYRDGAIIGHEASGIIEEVGAGVTGWQPGDRVVVQPFDPCRQCHWCQKGEYQLCRNKHWVGIGTNPGGFAQFTTVKSTMLQRVPNNLDSDIAALAEPFAVALHAVRNAHINLGATALVMGAGPIGLLVVKSLALAGAKAVAVVEPSPTRGKLARQLGATAVFTPGGGDLLVEVGQTLGGEPDYVFDCAGTTQSLQSAADLARPHGKVLLVGVSRNPVPIVARTWGMKELELKACMGFRDEFPLALKHLAEDPESFRPLISEVISLEAVEQTLLDLQKPNQQIKVLVKP